MGVQEEVIDAIRAGHHRKAEIKKATGRTDGSINSRLYRMEKEGVVERETPGYFVLTGELKGTETLKELKERKDESKQELEEGERGGYTGESSENGEENKEENPYVKQVENQGEIKVEEVDEVEVELIPEEGACDDEDRDQGLVDTDTIEDQDFTLDDIEALVGAVYQIPGYLDERFALPENLIKNVSMVYYRYCVSKDINPLDFVPGELTLVMANIPILIHWKAAWSERSAEKKSKKSEQTKTELTKEGSN